MHKTSFGVRGATHLADPPESSSLGQVRRFSVRKLAEVSLEC